MGIIDRYLLRQFLRVFLICFISLAGLYAVFDAFSSLDEFLNYAEKHGNIAVILAEYYGFRCIWLFDRMSGILALTAGMFTITWFQRFNEVTALSAAGIPHRRIIAPAIAAAAVLSGLAAANREVLIPRVRDQLSRNAKDLAGDQAQDMRSRFDNDTQIVIGGSRTFAIDQRIHKPNLLLPDALSRHGRKLTAEDGFYQRPQSDRPGGYLLRKVSVPKNVEVRDSIALDGRTIIFFPADTSWLMPDECFVTSDVDFEQLTGGIASRNFSSTAELVRGLRNRSLDFGADVRVTIHARLVQPILDLTLMFLGLPLVMTQRGRNVFVSIGQCVLVVTGFTVVVLGSRYLGGVYLLQPALAAWLPLLIFVPTAVYTSEQLFA